MGLFVHGLFFVDFSAGFKLNLKKYFIEINYENMEIFEGFFLLKSGII